jgi:glycopeptide antibiotics resistance protein
MSMLKAAEGRTGNEPLRNFRALAFWAYLLVTITVLLWPFDLVFSPVKNGVRWIGKTNGIEFVRPGQVLSPLPTESFCNRFINGAGFSLEVWLASSNATQTGPARIVSYSLNPYLRNFTLGQSKDALVMRLRTTETDLDGTVPHLEVPHVFHASQPQHIVVTYDFAEQRVYVNGIKRAQARIPGGRLTNWDPALPLIFGNEFSGNRPWLGRLFFVAIYDRPLREKEIRRHAKAGWSSELGSSATPSRSINGLVARYVFSERAGERVADSNGTEQAVDLNIPREIHRPGSPFLEAAFGMRLRQIELLQDFILNVLGFIPFGFLLYRLLSGRLKTTLRTTILVILLGTLLTFAIESLQHFSLSRYSSLVDVFSNMLGTAVGVAAARFYAFRINRTN